MIEIKKIHGFKLHYDAERRLFVLIDSEGAEMGFSNTQDEAEDKAKELSKSEFKRIKIIDVYHEGQISQGEITSINRDSLEAWVSMEKSSASWGSGRQKISLRYNNSFYEATEANNKIIDGIKKHRAIVDQNLNEITELIDKLEKPINTEYFGLKK
jgi:hypothetical protein